MEKGILKEYSVRLLYENESNQDDFYFKSIRVEAFTHDEAIEIAESNFSFDGYVCKGCYGVFDTVTGYII